METTNLFDEIVTEVLGVDFIRDPEVPIIIADMREKSKIPQMLRENKDGDRPCLVIDYMLDTSDYLVSSRMGFEIKRGTDNKSIFDRLFDQAYRQNEAVEIAVIIFQKLKKYLKQFEGGPYENGSKGLARWFQNNYSCVLTESDEETAQWIYDSAKSEQKLKRSGHARSVPKKATLYQKKMFFWQGLPQIGAKLSKTFNKPKPEGYDGNILEFLNDINKIEIEYTKSGNIRAKKYFHIKGVGAKMILQWQEVLRKNDTTNDDLEVIENKE